MNYIVYMLWEKGTKMHEEYRHFMELQDAQEFAERTAEEFKKQYNGFSVLIYEITNY